MEPKPFSYDLITYGGVVLLAVWGGAINYFGKLRDQHRRFSVAELLGELATSGFAGILTFWLLEHLGTPPLLEAFLIGISGHMSSRTLFLAERMLERRLLPGEEGTDDQG
jgi:hypothetical protein